MASAAIQIYRLLGAVATPLVRRHLRRRCARGREDRARLGERSGHPGIPRPAGPVVWIHGASVGESLSALPLVHRIRSDWPGLRILVTTGTVTSAKLMAERLPEGAVHQYVPVDLPASVGRFLAHWRPALGLFIESEFWPNILVQSRARGTDLVLVNGRVSAESFLGWRRVRPVIAYLLGQFSLVLAQSPTDLQHLRELGAGEARSLGNLKFAAAPLAADEGALAAARAALGGRPCWLAAQTHAGEEEIVAAAHAAIAARHPGLLTIIAPRHPHRGKKIARLMAAAGLRATRQGAGQSLARDTDIHVADALGELGLWYRLADIVFMGNSLAPKGGHNILEPAKLDCAILCGPHMENFARITEEMRDTGAIRQVADGAQLAAAVASLLGDPDARRSMARAGAEYAEAQAGVLDPIMAALGPHLDRAARTSP